MPVNLTQFEEESHSLGCSKMRIGDYAVTRNLMVLLNVMKYFGYLIVQ